jgi:hypothetical protein
MTDRVPRIAEVMASLRGGSATIHGKASCAHAEGVRGHRLEEGRSAVQEATLVGMDAVY